MVTIIDYGMGNLRSVEKACRHLGVKAKVSAAPKEIARAKKIVFPGVGNFDAAVAELNGRVLFELLQDKIAEGTPFLGICLGMQLLLETSAEAPGVRGLGVIKGSVEKFSDKKLIVPQMGWNSIDFKSKDKLFRGVKNGSYFYFANSYYCKPQSGSVVLATADYGTEYAAVLRQNNVWGVQFHPEKSQSVGLKLFANFLNLCG